MLGRLAQVAVGLLLVLGLVGHVAPANADPPRGHVSLTTSARHVVAGQDVTLTASVRQGRSRATGRVVVQQRIRSTWRTLSTKRLGRRGAASVRITPAEGVSAYRAVRPRTKNIARATSRTVTVTAAARPATTPTPTPKSVRVPAPVAVSGIRDVEVAAGKDAVVEGSVAPFVAGSVVNLEAILDGTWTTVADTTTSSTGTFRLTTSPPPGNRTYRVVTAGSDDVAAGRSASFTITVRTGQAPAAQTVNGPGTALRVSVPGETSRVNFTLVDTRRVALAIDDVVGLGSGHRDVLTVVDPLGSRVVLTPSRPGDVGRWTFEPSTSGTYTAVLDPGHDDVGGFTLFVSTTLTRSVTANGTAVPVDTGVPGRAVALTVDASAGDYVSWFAGDSATWRTDVVLVDLSDGSLVPLLGESMWQAPGTGTYRVHFEPTIATVLSADLTVSTTTARSMTVNGDTSIVTSTRAGAPTVLAFSTSAGEQVTIAASQIERPDNARYAVKIIAPGGYAHGGFSTPYDLESFPVRVAGTYLVVVTATGTPPVTMRLDVTTPVERAVLPNGSSVTLTSQGRAGQTLRATFPARAGDFVSISTANLTTGPVNPTRHAFAHTQLIDDATGNTLSTVDSRASGIYSIPADGTYRWVYSPSSAYSASFDVTVPSTRAVPITAGAPATSVVVERPGGSRVYTFEVSEGQDVVVTMSGSDASKYLVHAAGAVRGEYIGPNPLSARLVTLRGGTVELVVTGPSGATGTQPLMLQVTPAQP